MNSFFLSVKPEERENILSQHREVYNGYQTLNPAAMNGTQPLYTQDFANDKMGMVVNNKGEVKAYTNMGINESRMDFSPLGYAKKVIRGEMSVEDAIEESGLTFMMISKLVKKLTGNSLDIREEEMCEQCNEEMDEQDDYKDLSMYNPYYGDDDDDYTLDIDYEEIDEIYADDMDVSDEEPAYQFVSHGPDDVYGTMQDYDKETGSYHKIDSMNDVERYDDSSDINNMFGDLVDGLAFNDDEPSDTFQHDAGDIDREGDSGLGMDTENDMDLSKVKPAYDFMSDGPDDPYGVSEEEDLEEMVDEDLRESFKEKRKLVMEMMNRMSKF